MEKGGGDSVRVRRVEEENIYEEEERKKWRKGWGWGVKGWVGGKGDYR